jgi:hypothetical protein
MWCRSVQTFERVRVESSANIFVFVGCMYCILLLEKERFYQHNPSLKFFFFDLGKE